ncbi:cellobiose phosphorylase [Paenibacillus sp. 7124]|uniref:Cellobiose phosphorylase n=1 Tax=Paenibacillus apii TaxID=1850370 RepID=A0A6M1PT16_9BACL|nr:cellobiose phosphorylase [Paenibacillus apii]NGM85202.1 cellobiose phosphorylase [Paenibacillus apii]
MPAYYFEDRNFVIEEFDQAKTFSSFLPGLAGRKGIPLWAFYVNRGQGIASFGIRDKNSPIMEFSPASISYKNVAVNGFRTFIKLGGNSSVYEPFQDLGENPAVKRTMRIGRNELAIEEINRTLKLQVKVVYFNVPDEGFAALARHVEIVNLDGSPLSLEVLDGLPEILPYGVDNAGYKAMGNLLRSWMEVYNLERAIPFFKLRSSTKDEAEISEFASGHFCLSFSDEERLIPPLVDYETIFGYNTSLFYPSEFAKTSLAELLNRPQITANKVPCGFAGKSAELAPGQSVNLYTLIGHTNDIEVMNSRAGHLCSREYFRRKREEAEKLAERLTDDMHTSSSSPLFDAYCRQSYLDNVLRGGTPILFGKGKEAKVYHLFSRKHGDLERDYNFFSIAPEYYSQGNGNFRDMNQNRRNDVFFNPDSGAFNIYMFFSLIQADGYNPLLVKGSTFRVPGKRRNELAEWLESAVDSHRSELAELTAGPFTPGRVIHFIEDNGVRLQIGEEEFLEKLIGLSEQSIEANFGEGYWIDHWTYNLDLVESYRAVFPDKMEELLFSPGTCLFFDSPSRVLPRSEKTVLKNGKVRQYGAAVHDEEKLVRFGIGMEDTRWLKTGSGYGEVYRSNLFVKMLSLALIKMSTLDPYGMGIEMEGNKPGWNDAMNGLPGLFGSGMGETFELKRLINFILKTLSDMRKHNDFAARSAVLPEEMYNLLIWVYEIVSLRMKNKLTDFECWDQTASARERYREMVRFGITGRETPVSYSTLQTIYQLFLQRLEQGIAKALELGGGLVPTYFRFEAEEYASLTDNNGNPVIAGCGLPAVTVSRFRAEALPAFLEGPVHMLKTVDSPGQAEEIYRAVRASGLYDEKLKMYKTSVSLEEQPQEIGRIRAFTPGWLERESIFLHMSYKYLLELLKTGLTGPFFVEFRNTLIPFQDPAVYGRSTLENSSFLASGVNPDPTVHGRGYVARLSGSTAEFISIWMLMMAGKQPFRLGPGEELILRLEPVLPGWLFSEDGRLSFRFLGSAEVTYLNERRADTFGDAGVSVRSITLRDKAGSETRVEGCELAGAIAEGVRSGLYPELEVLLG